MNASARIALTGLVALLLMVGVFSARPWLLDRTEYALLDWRFRVRGATPPVSKVVIVAVDAKSIDEIGRWPWSRGVVAQLIDELGNAGAVAIGLDFIFSEPETSADFEAIRLARETLVARSAEEPELAAQIATLDRTLDGADTDQRLADAIRNSRKTVLGYFFRTGRGEDDSPEALARALSTIRRSKFSVARAPARAPVLTCTGLEANIPLIQGAARRAGFFSAVNDPDGVLRRAALVARCSDEFYMSLALGVYEIATGKRSQLHGDAESLTEIRVGNRVFPTDEGGKILINYRGPPGTFPHVSATDIVHGRVATDLIDGAIALIGPTEVGLRDSHLTPFGKSAPGVEVHANIVDNLLEGEVLRRHDWMIFAELGLIFAIGGLLILALPRLGSAALAALFAAAIGGTLLAGNVLAFTRYGLWINLAYPLASLVVVYVALEIARSVTVEASSRRIRRMFATYVPPEVVDELTENQGSFKLVGERRDLSILFSDVRDFTTLSERLGAESVARLMNVYLTAMTDIIFDSRGTLDKYIGDAIVAFWGAPLPVDDHPRRTCESAIAMQLEIARLRAEQRDLPGVENLRVGIGIHSGEVVVGNLGSERRFDYTVTGDGVNLCSRLEGLTKFYGVSILASADLIARLPAGFLTREIDTIRVKGKRSTVHIAEVVGQRSAEGDELTRFDAYAAGLAAYRDGKWDEAESALRAALAASANADGPSLALLERIATLRVDERDDWDGVWSFENK